MALRHLTGARVFVFWGSTAALGLGLIGVSLPAISAVAGGSLLAAIGGLYVVHKLATIPQNFASRIRERRADANALYLTRDLEGAENAMAFLHDGPAEAAPRVSALKEAFRSHPTHRNRVKSLRAAFARVAALPKPVNDNAPAEMGKKMKPAA